MPTGAASRSGAKLSFRPIPAGPARVAALLAGDVDLIEDTPTADIERLKKEPKVEISQIASNRLIYFFIDHAREVTPFAKAKDGSEIKNPFKDKRVREAMTKAINRDAIVSRVMEGVAVPAGQLLPDGYFGVSPKLKPVAYDPDGAKKLLAAAGFPNGFKLTLHTPNGRYTNDVKIAEAVAQMLTRVGIETTLEALPPAVFFTRASQGGPDKSPEFSFILVGWATPTGENSGSLVPLAQHLRPVQGHRNGQPRPLFQPGGGPTVGRGAQDQRRCQARRAAGEGDRDRHRGRGAHSLPLPGQHLVGAQGPQVQGTLG